MNFGDMFLSSISTITNMSDSYSLAEYQKNANIRSKEREIITMKKEIEVITYNCQFIEFQIQKNTEVLKFLDETIESEYKNEQLLRRARIMLEQKYKDDIVKIEKEKENRKIQLNQHRESLNRFKEAFEKLPHVIKLRETEIERKKAEIQCKIMQQNATDQKRKNQQHAVIKQRIFHLKIMNIVKNIMKIQRLDQEREQVLLEQQEIITKYDEKLKAETETNTRQNSKILRNTVSTSLEGLTEFNFRWQEKIKGFVELFTGKIKNLENTSPQKRPLEIPTNIGESHFKRFKNISTEINQQQIIAANEIQNKIPRDIKNKEELENLQTKQICDVPKKTKKDLPEILNVEIVQNMKQYVNLNIQNQEPVQIHDKFCLQEQVIVGLQNGTPSGGQESIDIISTTNRDLELDNMPYREQKSHSEKPTTSKSTQGSNYVKFEQKILAASTPYIPESLSLEKKLDQVPILVEKNYNTPSDQPNNSQTVSKFFKQNEQGNTNSEQIVQSYAENVTTEPSTQTILQTDAINSSFMNEVNDALDENLYTGYVSPPIVLPSWDTTAYNGRGLEFGAVQAAQQQNNFMYPESPKGNKNSLYDLF